MGAARVRRVAHFLRTEPVNRWLALFLVGGAVFSTADELSILASGTVQGRALDTAVVLSCGAAVAVAAWRTTAAALVVWVAAALAIASGNLGGAIIALWIVTALVAATASRPFVMVHGAVTGLWLVCAAILLPPVAGSLAWLVLPGLLICLSAGLALQGFVRNRRESERRIEDLEEQARQIREQERRALARDLHDVVAHELTLITLMVNGNRHVREGASLQGTLGSIGDTSQRAMVELRRLLDVMREGDPTRTPGPEGARVEASSHVLTQLGDNLTQVGIPTEVRVDPAFDTQSAVVRESCVRVAQEACTNVVKHAGQGSRCAVTVAVGETVDVRVHNTVPERAPVAGSFPRSGHGLVGARERVDLIGGTLESGAVDDGWLVRATVPLLPQDRF